MYGSLELYPITPDLLDLPSLPGRSKRNFRRVMLPPNTIRTAIEKELLRELATEAPPKWFPATSGLSEATVWRVEWGQSSFAIRRHPRGVDPAYVRRASSTLFAIKEAGLEFVAAPTSEPLLLADDRLWEIAPWLPGQSLAERGPDPAAEQSALAALVKFHELTRRNATESKPRSLFAERCRALEALDLRPTVAEHAAIPGPIQHVLKQLKTHLPEAAARANLATQRYTRVVQATQIIHGDARPEHFLLVGQEVTGLIDFGSMRWDSPLADVARLAGEIAEGAEPRLVELASVYSQMASTAIDPAQISVLDLSGAVLSAANWLRWLGQSDPTEVATSEIHGRLTSILARMTAVRRLL